MIPDELKKRKQWVCWKLVGADKRKVPFQPSWQPASSTDKSTWNSYEDCLAQSDKIGFVFTPDDPYIGVDLDGCRDAKTGVIESWAWDVLENFATYSEVSPSNTGVKLWGIFDGVWKHKNKVDFEGTHCGVEVYQTGRFFCVTGKVIAGFETIENITGGMEWFSEKFKMQKEELPQAVYVRKASSSSVVERASAYVSKIPPAIEKQGGHNRAFHVACVLVNGFMLDQADARSVFMEFNARCQPPWSESEITHKLTSAANSKGERGQLLNANSNDWGVIDVSRAWVEQKPAAKPKNEVRIKTLEQSAKDVAANNKAGRKSLITLGIPELDESIEGGADIGEMVIIGARPSHGKSAIALQMVHHMTKSFPVGIISQEMSALALGKRTLQFITEVPQDDWAIRSDEIDSDLDSHFAERKPALIVEGVTDINELCDTSMQLMEREGIKALFVDYAQIITGKGNTQYERVTDVSKRLRNMATNTGLLIITLAQLGREVEKRPDFFPTSKDLKDSGQLEQDADVIIFGVWPYKLDPKRERNHYQFFIDKNRNRNRVKHGFDLFFEPHRQRYLEESVAALNAAAMKNEFNFPKDF